MTMSLMRASAPEISAKKVRETVDEPKLSRQNSWLRRPSETESALSIAARAGDIETVKRLVNTKTSSSFINTASRQLKSGFSSSVYEGASYDLTPLAAAALCGRANCVEVLLRRLADPTLIGSPAPDIHMDAYMAAVRGYHQSQDVLAELRDLASSSSGTKLRRMVRRDLPAPVIARSLLDRNLDHQRCCSLIEAVLPYWKPAVYFGSPYNNDIRNSAGTYNNAPTNKEELLQALDDTMKMACGDKADDEQFEKLTKCIERLQQCESKAHDKIQRALTIEHGVLTTALEDQRLPMCSKKGIPRVITVERRFSTEFDSSPTGENNKRGKKRSSQISSDKLPVKKIRPQETPVAKCRFFIQGYCRDGDQCRFHHCSQSRITKPRTLIR